MKGVALQLLGGVVVRLGDGRDRSPSPRKARALLGYLALNRGGVSRERLAGLLWGDAPDAHARASLRQSLRAIRSALGTELSPALRSDGDRVELDVAAWSVDARELLGPLDEAHAADLPELSRRIGLYRGPLLEALCPDEPAFENWRLSREQALRDRLEELVTRAVTRCAEVGDSARALQLSLGLVNVDWSRESAHALLLTSYARKGQLATARAHFQRFKQQLQASLGTEPSALLLETYRSLPELALKAPTKESPGLGAATAAPEGPAAVEEERRQVSACQLRVLAPSVQDPETRHAEVALAWEAMRRAAHAHGADHVVLDADGALCLFGTGKGSPR